MLLTPPQTHRIVDWFMWACDQTNNIGTSAIYCLKIAHFVLSFLQSLYVRSIAIAEANETLRHNILSMYIVHIGQPM